MRNTRHVSRYLAPVLAAFALAGCGSDAPPELVSVQSACDDANRGKRVIVEGYLRLPVKIAISDSATIDLFALTGGDGDRVAVRLPIGDGPNQMADLPARFSPTSLRVGTLDGQQATIIDRVRLTGKSESIDGACTITEPTVELIPQ